jgi:hypothetical protein
LLLRWSEPNNLLRSVCYSFFMTPDSAHYRVPEKIHSMINPPLLRATFQKSSGIIAQYLNIADLPCSRIIGNRVIQRIKLTGTATSHPPSSVAPGVSACSHYFMKIRSPCPVNRHPNSNADLVRHILELRTCPKSVHSVSREEERLGDFKGLNWWA